MKRFLSILFFMNFCYSISSQPYIDTVDIIINQTMKAMTYNSLPDIVRLQKSLDNKISLEDLTVILQNNEFASFFLSESSENIKNIKFALGAKIYLYYLDCYEQKMLHKSLKNYESLKYWQQELFCENRDFLQKNILRWINPDNYKKEIQKNIEHLKAISKKTASFLGMIRHNKQILSDACNRDSFEENLMMAVRLQDTTLNVACRDYSSCNMYEIVISMAGLFNDFSLDLSAQYTESQPSHHLQRNWVAYTSTAVGLCALAIAYYSYKNDVDACASAAYEAGQYFWNDKIKAPVHKICNTLSGVNNPPLLDTQREKTILGALLIQGDLAQDPRGPEVTHVDVIVGDGSMLVGQATAYSIDRFWGLFGYQPQNLQREGIGMLPAIENNQRNYNNMSFADQEALKLRVAAKDSIILANPKANLNGVIPALERSVFSPMVEMQNALNKLYEENQLMIGLMAMFPAVSIAAGMTFASKKAYCIASYEPVRKVVRDLDMFLNEATSKSPSFEQEGKLYFITELLKRKCTVLSCKELQLMEEDIAELQSRYLTYTQKYNIVQRMYRTYAFLLPGAV